MTKAKKRTELLEHDLKKLEKLALEDDDPDSDDDDDDELDDRAAIKSEIAELKKENQIRQDKLDDYEKNKKWNVDNMCTVTQERTIINPSGGTSNFTDTGFAQNTIEVTPDTTNTSPTTPAAPTPTTESSDTAVEENKNKETTSNSNKDKKTNTTVVATKKTSTKKTTAAPSSGPAKAAPTGNTMYTYHEYTIKYADLVEVFMQITSLEESKEFILKHGEILLQENASNYLLLASLEDEMNGYREKMKLTARQSQLISNITDLAKQLNTHPGNVILSFFGRLSSHREYLEGFQKGVDNFTEKIIKRAVTKKIEMDKQREEEGSRGRSGDDSEAVDLEEIPKEQRLGPGGLDPLEVIPTLPMVIQKAFESRNVENLKKALLTLEPSDAEYHLKRCVDSGLWVAQA